MHISTRKLNLNQIIMYILFEMPLHFALKCQTATRILLHFLLDMFPSATIKTDFLSLTVFPSSFSPSYFPHIFFLDEDQKFLHLTGQRFVNCIELCVNSSGS